MKTAKLVKEYSRETDMDYTAKQELYELSYPLNGFRYVLVSATRTWDHGPETYIFGADEEGKVANWGELEGSYIGGLDHKKALNGAGYEIVG